jgi:hypothetical protein
LQLERRLGAGVIPAFLNLQSEKLGGAADGLGLLHGLAEAVNDEARRRGADLPFLIRRELGADPYPAFGRWLDTVEKTLAGCWLLLCLDEYEALEQGMAASRCRWRSATSSSTAAASTCCCPAAGRSTNCRPAGPAPWSTPSASPSASWTRTTPANSLCGRWRISQPTSTARRRWSSSLYLSHCQPYLVQVLCGLVVERLNKARRLPPDTRVEAADVSAVVASALERGQAYFSDLWRGQIGGEAARRILEALARQEDLRLPATALEALEPDPRECNAALRTLLRREIVGKGEESLRILVPLVGEYVRALSVV